jgi:hypothetical protein
MDVNVMTEEIFTMKRMEEATDYRLQAIGWRVLTTKGRKGT